MLLAFFEAASRSPALGVPVFLASLHGENVLVREGLDLVERSRRRPSVFKMLLPPQVNDREDLVHSEPTVLKLKVDDHSRLARIAEPRPKVEHIPVLDVKDCADMKGASAVRLNREIPADDDREVFMIPGDRFAPENEASPSARFDLVHFLGRDLDDPPPLSAPRLGTVDRATADAERPLGLLDVELNACPVFGYFRRSRCCLI